MNRWQRILYDSSFLLSLVLFYFAGIKAMPEEYHFEFQKIFVPCVFIVILIEAFRRFLGRSYERSVIKFLQELLRSQKLEIRALDQQHPLHHFQQGFVEVMQAVESASRSRMPEGSLNPIPYLQNLLSKDRDSREVAGTFLKDLHNLFPGAEIYLFHVGQEKIYSMAKIGHNGSTDLEFHVESKDFSLLSEFSGRVYQERTTRVTNDLKSDPNLGQFISPENPNVPIYGALFPLSDENRTRALLWIREGGSSLESIRDHLQIFEMLTEQLYQRLFQKPDLTQNTVLEALSFPQFDYYSSYFMSCAKIQRRYFNLSAIYVKLINPKNQKETILELADILRQQVTLPATMTQEDQLFFISTMTQSKQEAMIEAAKVLDRLVHYLSLEHGDEPIGEVNLGLVSLSDLNTPWQEVLRQCHSTLKESLNQGANQLRVYQLQNLDPLPQESINLDAQIEHGEA